MSNEQQTLVLDTEAFLKETSTFEQQAEAATKAAIIAFDKSVAMAKIDSDLALAIGHGIKSIFSVIDGASQEVWVCTHDETGEMNRFRFDHTDPRVIWPLARQYDCFPYKTSSGGWTTNLLAPSKENMDKGVDSAELAVALTIIQEYGL